MQQTDRQLLERFQAGEEDAFAEIVKRHQAVLLKTIGAVVRSRETAMDLAQETFFRLHRSKGNIRDPDGLAAHLKTIGVRLAISQNRRTRSWLALLPGLKAVTEEWARSTEDLAINDQAGRRLMDVIDDLTQKLRATVILSDLEGWSPEEIARASNCSVTTVKKRLVRAHTFIRGHLSDWWTGEKHDQRPERRSDHQCSEEPAAP